VSGAKEQSEEAMRTHLIQKAVRGRHVVALLLALVGASCSLDKVDIPSALVGPAELGLSLSLAANPDWVLADNVSRSDIVATLRDQNGNPVAGRAIVFAIQNEDGTYAAIGSLTVPTAVTDGSGVARTSYFAPARTDVLADTEVFIAARPSSNDAGGQQLRRVKIQIVPAERPLFPPKSGNTNPTCSIVTEPSVGPNGGAFNVGQLIQFQGVASDSDGNVVRYEWDFGDGEQHAGRPDTTHAYSSAAAYTVTLTVIDNNGGAGSCTKALTVQ
jgi:hypothetical protein